MSDNNRTELDAVVANIEEMWGRLDVLFEYLDVTGKWDQKHGPDWTYAPPGNRRSNRWPSGAAQ